MPLGEPFLEAVTGFLGRAWMRTTCGAAMPFRTNVAAQRCSMPTWPSRGRIVQPGQVSTSASSPADSAAVRSRPPLLGDGLDVVADPHGGTVADRADSSAVAAGVAALWLRVERLVLEISAVVAN